MPGEEGRLALVINEHRHVLELIEKRDPEGARAAMRVHIERARDNFMECLPLGRASD
jgi:DNA-binding GntR family transcriptional regulator